jgi:hypothetical protein
VTFQRQLLKPGPSPVFGPLKNKTPRTVEIAAETVALLRRHRSHQAELKLANGEHYHDHGLVFAKEWGDLARRRDTLGEPLQANNLGQREYAQLVKAAHVRDAASAGRGAGPCRPAVPGSQEDRDHPDRLCPRAAGDAAGRGGEAGGGAALTAVSPPRGSAGSPPGASAMGAVIPLTAT